jgi:hypothetical protein
MDAGGNRFFDESDALFDGLAIAQAECVGQPESAGSFHAALASSTDEPVELHLMGTEGSANEDIEVVRLDLWVR